MFPALYRLVRDVRDAPGRISRYWDPQVADDAIEAGYLVPNIQGRLSMTPAGEQAFDEESD